MHFVSPTATPTHRRRDSAGPGAEGSGPWNSRGGGGRESGMGAPGLRRVRSTLGVRNVAWSRGNAMHSGGSTPKAGGGGARLQGEVMYAARLLGTRCGRKALREAGEHISLAGTDEMLSMSSMGRRSTGTETGTGAGTGPGPRVRPLSQAPHTSTSSSRLTSEPSDKQEQGPDL